MDADKRFKNDFTNEVRLQPGVFNWNIVCSVGMIFQQRNTQIPKTTSVTPI